MSLESECMPPMRYCVGDVMLFREGAHVKWHVESQVKKIAFPAPLYVLMGKTYYDAAPAHFSWRRKTHNVN